MGQKSLTGGIRAKGGNIQFDFEYQGTRYRPTLRRMPSEANLPRARAQLLEIKSRIQAGTFVFANEFPDYTRVSAPATLAERSCDPLFDEFLAHCDTRVSMKDLAFATYNGYRKLLAQVWRPAMGTRLFAEVRYSDLARVVTGGPYHARHSSVTWWLMIGGHFLSPCVPRIWH